jgi:hypothetical protein
MNPAAARDAAPPGNARTIPTTVVRRNAKCIRQSALIAVKKQWSLSNQAVINRFIAGNAFKRCAANTMMHRLKWRLNRVIVRFVFLASVHKQKSEVIVMTNGDGTESRCFGSKTGRTAGYCASLATPKLTNQAFGSCSRGLCCRYSVTGRFNWTDYPGVALPIADDPAWERGAAALNPRMKIGQIITEPLKVNHLIRDKNQLQDKFSFLLIAHDLSIIKYICDKVAVMLHGKFMEIATTKELFANPLHPYTQSLLSAVPIPDPIYERNKQLLDYDVKRAKIDGEMVEVSPGHYVLKFNGDGGVWHAGV